MSSILIIVFTLTGICTEQRYSVSPFFVLKEQKCLFFIYLLAQWMYEGICCVFKKRHSLK